MFNPLPTGPPDANSFIDLVLGNRKNFTNFNLISIKFYTCKMHCLLTFCALGDMNSSILVCFRYMLYESDKIAHKSV